MDVEAISEVVTITLKVRVTVSIDAEEYSLPRAARRQELKRHAADLMISAVEAMPRVEQGALFEVASV